MDGAISRRHLLRASAAVTLGFRGLALLLAAPARGALRDGAGFGPLKRDPQRMLDLPQGFSYRVLSRRGERMDDGLLVPGQPDGMGAFAGQDGKTILIRNHELEARWTDRGPFGKKNELLGRAPRELLYDAGYGRQPCLGGTTTLLVDRGGRVERQFLSLAGTEFNCAGGPTPWNSWISCEETVQRADENFEEDHGYPFEVPAQITSAPCQPIPLAAMGRFRREAVAVDPRSSIVFQTEDRDDGLIYRFIPHVPRQLHSGGRLQALCVVDQPSLDTRNWPGGGPKRAPTAVRVGHKLQVSWMDLEQITSPADDLRLRGFARGAARFARGEGMWYGRDAVYFACTNGGRKKLGQIWRYRPSPFEGAGRETEQPGALELFAEPNDKSVVNNADNLTVAPWGDLIVCEDSEDVNRLVGVTPAGEFYVLARNRKDKSEFAGATFSPDGAMLFVNLQELGATLAIRGPWRG